MSPHSRIASELPPWLRGTIAVGCLLLLSPALRAAVPADPVVELRFPEGAEGIGGNGITTTNTGTYEGSATFVQPQDDPIYEVPTVLAPIFSTNVPVGTYVPAMNDFAVDMGPIQGNSLGGTHGRAIDLLPNLSPAPPTVGAFPELTIVGWLNARQVPGSVPCRILYASESPNGLGFDLVMYNNGVLSLGINQNAGNTLTSTLQVPIDANTPSNNWVFFAVSYNPALVSGQLKYYFGRQDKLAALDIERDYTPPIFTTIDYTGQLTVGNLSPVDGGRDSLLGGNSAIFRGLLDEVKLYTNALTLDQVQEAQLNSAVTPVAASIITPPANTTAVEGQNPTFQVDATGSGDLTYQWKTNNVDVLGATDASLTLSNVALSFNNLAVTVGVSNTVGGVLSAAATLTVLPANPLVVATSFSEGGTAPNTANLGSLAGYGRIQRSGGLPAFVATNLPSGAATPSATHNAAAIAYSLPDGGNRAIDLTNNLVSSEGELGSMDAVTICGWINSANNTFRTTSTGRGSGVVSATRGGTAGGFVLNYRSDDLGPTYGQNGRLQFHVNEFNVNTGRESSASTIPLDVNLSPNNWVFFAVTYDGTATTDNLAYYFGDQTNLATNDVVLTYNRGIIPVTGQLTIGNYQRATGNPTGRTVSGANGAAFRGLIDEVKIFSKVLNLSEIQAQQTTPTLPTLLVYSNSGPDLVLSWETLPAYPYQLQSRTNLSIGSWNNVGTAESVLGNVHSVVAPRDKEVEFFRINRQ